MSACFPWRETVSLLWTFLTSGLSLDFVFCFTHFLVINLIVRYFDSSLCYFIAQLCSTIVSFRSTSGISVGTFLRNLMDYPCTCFMPSGGESDYYMSSSILFLVWLGNVLLKETDYYKECFFSMAKLQIIAKWDTFIMEMCCIKYYTCLTASVLQVLCAWFNCQDLGLTCFQRSCF